MRPWTATHHLATCPLGSNSLHAAKILELKDKHMRNFRESGFRITLPEHSEDQCVWPIYSFPFQLHPLHSLCRPSCSMILLFLMRQAPEGWSREERQASGPLHHSSGGCRLAGQTNDTATAPAGAGPWHCRKRSHEAKNGHADCQRGRLDGRTESDPSEQNDTMRSHGTFLHLDIAFSGFASRESPPKTVPRG